MQSQSNLLLLSLCPLKFFHLRRNVNVFLCFHADNFREFPSLKSLELPLNNIGGNVVINEKDFTSLDTLDLSCNGLTANDILALGVLPALKVLHLTGNLC